MKSFNVGMNKGINATMDDSALSRFKEIMSYDEFVRKIRAGFKYTVNDIGPVNNKGEGVFVYSKTGTYANDEPYYISHNRIMKLYMLIPNPPYIKVSRRADPYYDEKFKLYVGHTRMEEMAREFPLEVLAERMSEYTSEHLETFVFLPDGKIDLC